MVLDANKNDLHNIPGLDEIFYSPTSEELSFFLTETGIHDEAVLKSHLIDVQARAYAVSFLAIFCPALKWPHV